MVEEDREKIAALELADHLKDIYARVARLEERMDTIYVFFYAVAEAFVKADAEKQKAKKEKP